MKVKVKEYNKYTAAAQMNEHDDDLEIAATQNDLDYESYL